MDIRDSAEGAALASEIQTICVLLLTGIIEAYDGNDVKKAGPDERAAEEAGRSAWPDSRMRQGRVPAPSGGRAGSFSSGNTVLGMTLLEIMFSVLLPPQEAS